LHLDKVPNRDLGAVLALKAIDLYVNT